MEFLKNIWNWVTENPGKSLAAATSVAAAGGYSLAPWIKAVIGVLSQAVGQ